MNNNKKFKKLIKKLKFKRTRKFRRKTNSITNHRYLVKQDFVFDGTNYQQQNLNLNTVDILWTNVLFQKYSELYQYLKIANIRVDLTAVQKNGSNPPAGYMAFLGNESLGVKYSDIPMLPYAKKIKPVGTTSVLFTRPGRNDDFNRWYNTQSNVELQRAEASIRFRFVETFSENGPYYMVRISFDIRFDKPYVYSSTKEAEPECKVKPSADSKPIIIDKDEEEFDKAWEEVPEDDDIEEENGSDHQQ
jgi:hypothetical protein